MVTPRETAAYDTWTFRVNEDGSRRIRKTENGRVVVDGVLPPDVWRGVERELANPAGASVELARGPHFTRGPGGDVRLVFRERNDPKGAVHRDAVFSAHLWLALTADDPPAPPAPTPARDEGAPPP